MLIVVGVMLGIAREFLVCRYYIAVQERLALLGSGLSLGIGLLDLGVIAKIMLDGNISMALGYCFGEALGTYLAVNMRKK